MDKLNYILTADYSEIKKGQLYIGCDLTIDGVSPLSNRDMDDFDVLELFLSVNPSKDEPLFIFTCGCGIAGCAGYIDGIEVTHNVNTINWLDQDQDRQYEFPKGAYLATIHALYNELVQWKDKADVDNLVLKLFPDWNEMEEILKAYTTNKNN